MKINYRVVMVCSDRMKNGKDISFEIPVAVPFETHQEAEDNVSSFSISMERLDDEVVINIWWKEEQEQKPIETIRWENWNLYKCSITKDSSVGKGIINPLEDEEPCAMTFSEILPLLTEKNSFSIQYLAYGIEPFYLHEQKGN